MVEITIFELNLDGAEFTANAPGKELAGVEPEDTDEAGGGFPTGLVLAAVAALVASAVAVVAVKKFRGGETSSGTPT